MNKVDVRCTAYERSLNGNNLLFIKKAYGRDVTVGLIMVLLTDLNSTFNIKGGLNATQIIQLGERIYDEVCTIMNLEELIYIFYHKKGSAKLFDRLDMPVILGWIDEHFELRAQQRDDHHKQNKNTDYVPEYTSDIANKFRIPIAAGSAMDRRYSSRDNNNR